VRLCARVEVNCDIESLLASKLIEDRAPVGWEFIGEYSQLFQDNPLILRIVHAIYP